MLGYRHCSWAPGVLTGQLPGTPGQRLPRSLPTLPLHSAPCQPEHTAISLNPSTTPAQPSLPFQPVLPLATHLSGIRQALQLSSSTLSSFGPPYCCPVRSRLQHSSWQ